MAHDGALFVFPMETDHARHRPKIKTVLSRLLLGFVFLLLLLAAFAATIAPWDNSITYPMLMGCGIAVVFWSWVWVCLFSPWSNSLRMSIAGTGIAVILATIGCVRISGFSGYFIPELSFVWSPKKDALLPALENSSRSVQLIHGPHDVHEFLGPNRRPEYLNVTWAEDWQARGLVEVWRKPIGLGWSSFCVVGDYAFTMEQRDQQEVVTCLEIKNGALAWSSVMNSRYDSVVGGDGPRCTPTYSDGRLYSMGANGILRCLDATNGAEFWHKNVLELARTRNTDWGMSCSPLVAGELVIVTAGKLDSTRTTTGTVIAFDRISGEVVWQSGDHAGSFASPQVATVAGKQQLLVMHADLLAGYDLENGNLLWSQPWPNGQPTVAQPVVVSDDTIFLSKGYGVGSGLFQVTAGQQSAVEIWRSTSLRTKFCNVVVSQDHIFGLDDGVLACQNLQTGSRNWRSGRFGHGQIMLVGDKIIVQCENGDIAVVAANPEAFDLLLQQPVLKDKTWNQCVLAGTRLLTRNDSEVVCLELPITRD